MKSVWTSILVFVFAPTSVLAQEVIPDGTTKTSVQELASRRIEVGIAPTDTTGTSLNRYEKFSVPEAGLQLNNSTVGADLIINEVTSSLRSIVRGEVSIIGPQADFVLANPNGITVNGGSFATTGSVALATGKVLSLADGRFQLDVTGGHLEIGASGLSGQMAQLDLLSKTMRINGALVSHADGQSWLATIVAGESRSTLSPASLRDADFGWLKSEANGGASDGVSIDITRAASIRSGRIRIKVTDLGAGVRIAGATQAVAGGFKLTSSGKLEISGARLEASGGVDSATLAAPLDALRGVDITASEVVIAADGDVASEVTSSDSGVIVKVVGGSLTVVGSSINGTAVVSTNQSSAGDVTLIADNGISLLGSGDLRSTVRSSGSDPKRPSDGNIVINSEGDIQTSQTDIFSDLDVFMQAVGAVDLDRSVIQAARDIDIFAEMHGTTITGGSLEAVQDVHIKAENIKLVSTEAERLEVKAINGSAFFETTGGDFVNLGASVEGFSKSATLKGSLGGVTVDSQGDIVNISLDEQRLAILFSREDRPDVVHREVIDREGDLVLKTAGNVENTTGRLLSNKGIIIEAGGAFSNQTYFETNQPEASETVEFQTDRNISNAFLGSKKMKLNASYGSPVVSGEIATLIAIKDINISAGSINNSAADISGANVRLNALDRINNISRLAGAVSFRQSCVLIFCSSSGKSDISLLPATITAVENMYLTAGISINDVGGQLRATGDLIIDGPEFVARSLQVPVLLERPSGLTSFFRGRMAWVAHDFQGSLIAAIHGDLNFLPDGIVSVSESAKLIAGGENGVPDTITSTAEPYDHVDVMLAPIGFLWRFGQ